MYQLNQFDKETFLKEYWQKKPLLIKQGFPDFADPLTEHELAGLAQEGDVDSRIVSFHQEQWQVTHGPFEDINAACTGAWSLLVQSVDHFSSEADQLMRAFDFIPHWRMDDLMVSYSNRGAGVGAHIDQYDVFIIQGKGSRHWQVGLPGKFESMKPHKDLNQISPFSPIIDEVLHPGDIVYIPPNHPHNGQALEACLNYSVGFRAPSAQQMLSSFTDYAIDNNILSQLYQDGQMDSRDFSGEIKQQEAQRLQAFLQQALQSDHFLNWLPSFMSQSLDIQEDEIHDSSDYTHQDILERLSSGATFCRTPGIKPVFIEKHMDKDQLFSFFIEGTEYSVPQIGTELVKKFLNMHSFDKNVENNCHNCLFFTQLLTTLVNSGYWYPE